jgi:hypothetical protein
MLYQGKDKMSGVRLWLGVTGMSLLALLFGACAPANTPADETITLPSPGSDAFQVNSPPELEGPALSDALKRGCQRTGTSGGFQNIGLAEGEVAVDFTLNNIDGNTVTLSGLLAEKPVVMVFGSFT